MAVPDNDNNALLKIHVDNKILNDPKIVDMEPIVFTRRLNHTKFMKAYEHRVWNRKHKHYVHPFEMLPEETKPKYNPRNVSNEKLYSHLDITTFNKFVDKLLRVNIKTQERKQLQIQQLMSSVELAFESIKAQQQQGTNLSTDTNIENNNKNITITKQSDDEDWSSEDEETLVTLLKKTDSPPIRNTINNKENLTVIQPKEKASITPMKKSGPISIIFANQGIMAVHQGTKQERYDIGSDGCLGRFYIKLPPPPMEEFDWVVKIVCCVYKRAKVINELVEEFVIQPSAVNFMTTIHKCPVGNCMCCCKTKFTDIESSLEASLKTPLVTSALLTDVPQGRDSPITAEFNSFKTLEELIKTLTTNFNGITLNASANNKLTAIFSTTPSSWDSTKVRILTEILTQISQKLISSGKSIHDFCKQINTMVFKRNLFSSASRLMGAKQTKSIIFMKIDEINKLDDTTPSNDAVAKNPEVPIDCSSQKEQTRTKNKKSRKRISDDVYEPVLTKRQTKPSLSHETYKKWAKSHKPNGYTVSVTQLLSELTNKQPTKRERKKNTKPKSHLNRLNDNVPMSTRYPTEKSVREPQKPESPQAAQIPENPKAPQKPETLQVPQKSQTPPEEFQMSVHEHRVLNIVQQPSQQDQISCNEVPKKNPILYEILKNKNIADVTSDKFNVTKLPIEYLVSKPVENDAVPNYSMASLIPNQCIELSSDEEVIDLG